MRKHLFLVFIFFVLAGFSSCKRNVLKGAGSKNTTAPSVASFSAIDMSLPLKASITVQEGATSSVQLEGYENIIKHIRAKVENNTLHLNTDLDETWTLDNKDIKVTITVPLLTALSLSGTCDADIHGNIIGKSFQLSNSGTSNVIIDNTNTDDFSAQISGVCDLTVKGGSAKNASYSISGAGTIKSFPLQADVTTATISGAGKTEVTALQKLTAKVDGAGTVKYKGHPQITKEVSGVGAVSDAN